MANWSEFDGAEQVAGKLSGAWVIKGTRIRVDDVLANAIDQTPDEIVSAVYPSLTLEQVRRILAFAGQREYAHSS